MITEFSPVFVRMFSCELHTIRGRPLSKRGSSAGQWIVDPFWDISDRMGLVFDIRAHINQWLRHVCVPTRKHAGFTQTNRAGSAERKSFRKTFFNKISPFFLVRLLDCYPAVLPIHCFSPIDSASPVIIIPWARMTTFLNFKIYFCFPFSTWKSGVLFRAVHSFLAASLFSGFSKKNHQQQQKTALLFHLSSHNIGHKPLRTTQQRPNFNSNRASKNG